jgi:NAD(P)H dehydrogenase (quinone)
VIYYSMYGHIGALAKALKEGVDSVDGVEGVLYQVAETLPADVLEKMHAPAKDAAVPVAVPGTIDQADGFAFGTPTRFGMMSAQMKAFFDGALMMGGLGRVSLGSDCVVAFRQPDAPTHPHTTHTQPPYPATGGHWQKGSLVGKPATIFTSTATQGSGMETTVMTAVTQLAHHGMIFVPPGYSFGAKMFQLETPKGGSPWGAGTLAGPDGSRQPTEDELAYARHQGKLIAGVTKKLAA